MKMKIRTEILRTALAAAMASALIGNLPAAAQEPPGIMAFASEQEPPSFDTPEAAMEAFKTALLADDFSGVMKLLGLDEAAVKASEDTMTTYALMRAGAAKQMILRDLGNRKVLDVGEILWPMPFPLSEDSDGKWAFNTFAGFEEIINRRIGENELEAILTLRTYLDAQIEYAREDHDGDGVLEYARKLISSDGARDGLYWPLEEGEEISPVGLYISLAIPGEEGDEDGYFGYHYKILEGQGDRIAGGSYDYVINDNMIAGHALLAWPARYGETGVQSFLISHQGIAYEADLGPATGDIVTYIDRFNPNDSWTLLEN